MSRSYRHSNIVKQQNSKDMKKFANKKVRRHAMDLPKKGKAYKKLFETWEICDWRWTWSRESAIAEWHSNMAEAEQGVNTYRHYNNWFTKKYPTLEKYLKYWEKCVRRK